MRRLVTLTISRMRYEMTTRLACVIAILSLGTGCVSSSELERVVHERDSLRTILDSIKTDPAELVATAQRAIRDGKPEEAQKTLTRIGGRRLDAGIAQDVASLKDSAAVMIARAGQEAARQKAALDQARADSAKRETQRLAQALSRTYTHRDEVQDITFYYAKGISRYVNGPSQITLYVAKPDNGTASLYMRIRYSADDWLFVESYTFKIDGRTFDVTPVGYDAVKRDNGSGERSGIRLTPTPRWNSSRR
jgi:hypothetical protein